MTMNALKNPNTGTATEIAIMDGQDFEDYLDRTYEYCEARAAARKSYRAAIGVTP